ncbi:ABC-2 type transport system permease protein [Chitinophaga niastensis]|uniref:ABC-2 type transport system permease protein n=1 Tax=Chitinophaga niastensis TaxID=536980 RepID=A0A2P8H8I9_CHINA|nr:ABC transporter permease [Chitinophaga niastensis]PSL42500.1 ABC-2 type transport system permease protein [Chitinophaga niastensis]
MFDSFRHIIRLFLREAKMVAHDHSLLLTLLIAPLLYAFFYGSLYSYKVEEKVKLAVADDDKSELSRAFLQQLNKMQIADVVGAVNLSDAQEKMYRGDCQGYLYIPDGVQKKVLALQQGDIVLAVNAARFLPSSELAGAVTKLAMTVGAGVRLKYNEMQGLNTAMAMQETQPVNLDYRPLYNTRSSYGAFLLPGLLALILQQTMLLGLAGSVALDKQRRHIPELVRTGGGSLSTALWGKGLFYMILFFCYACFFMTVNYATLDIPFRGRVFDVAVAFILFFFTLIPLGVWLGSLFNSQLLAAQLLAFSTYPIFLVSGYAWPYESLPVPMQWLSSMVPTTPFLHIYQSIVQSGATLQQNVPSMLHLLALWAFYVLLALLSLRRLNKQQQALSL